MIWLRTFSVMLFHFFLFWTQGRAFTNEGVEIIGEYIVQAYPFNTERHEELRVEEETLRAT